MVSGIGRRALTSAFCLLTLAAATVANAQLINEFQPNPAGTDPDPGSIEFLGTPNSAFSGVLIARETDDATGNINSVEAVAGMFDANGILSVSIADLENPSFDLILVDAFTGSAGVDTINSMADLMALGTTTVYDAIGIVDAQADTLNSIASALGGTVILYTGDEPQVAFRNSDNPNFWIVINDPAGAFAFSLAGSQGSQFDLASDFADAGGTPIDLSAGPFTTFGAPNYRLIEATGSCATMFPPDCFDGPESGCDPADFTEGGTCPTGACTIGNVGCIEGVTSLQCFILGGDLSTGSGFGFATGGACATPAIGSCSNLSPGAACIITTDTDCTMMGGTFVEDGMCPTGACTTNGLCSLETEEDCLNGGGTYDGDGTMCPGLSSDIQINEFEPNPPGVDPNPTSFEIRGPIGMAFNGFLLAVETDVAGDTGSVQAVFAIGGVFDGNGLLTASIDDLENPSFALFLVDTYTGPTDGSGILDSADDLATLGITTVFDAISISDAAGDIANSIAGGIGGLDFPFTGDEPKLVFRDGFDPTIIYAINDPATTAEDQFGNTYVLATDFSLVDGTAVNLDTASPLPTFFAPNYTTQVAEPTGACADLASSPSCVLVRETECMMLGGTFTISTTCPTGACNLPDTTCIITTDEDCLSQGGTYTGDDTPCTGACCDLVSNDCTPNVSSASCDADGGLYLGDNSDCSGGCPTVVPEGIVLNEVRLDNPGTDSDYIELAGMPGTDLTGLQVIVVGDPGSGNVERVIDLAGQSMGADGIFLIADPATLTVAFDVIDLPIAGFSNENSDNLTFFLVFGATVAPGDDLDANDDCLIDTPEPWTAELDRVALIETPNDALAGGECHYATEAVMGGGGMGCPDCAGDFDNSGTRDGGDIMGFVDALLNTGDACADINADTFVDGLDIAPFITLITGQTACPGGVMVVDVPEQIVGPDAIFVPGHAFRLDNEIGPWRQGEFDPANSFDTAGTVNMVPDGACCTEMGCVIIDPFNCDDMGGLFRGEMATCMDAGICDPQGISGAQGGPDALGLGFIIGPVTVVETVDNDTDTADDRTFTVQDESGFPLGSAGTTRGLTITFDEVANPALGAFVDTLNEGDCINVSGTTEDIAGGLFLRIDDVSDIATGQVGCAAINVPLLLGNEFTGGTPESEALGSVRVQLDCALFRDGGNFAPDTTYPVTDGGATDVDVRVNSAAGGAMPILGTAIPTDAVRIEGIYSLAFGPQLMLHEADDLITTNCFGDFGACCFSNGTCANVSTSICAQLGGQFNFGFTCAQVNCLAETGACCTDDVCAEGITQLSCESGGGLYFGDDSTCPAQCPNQNSLEISEIRRDQSGSDADEYIEIAGEPGTPMSGLTYVIIGDSSGGSGIIEEVIDLSGQVIPADGYWVMAEDTSFPNIPMVPGGIDLVTAINLENGDNVTHLIVTNFSSSNGADLDAEDNCILDSEPWGTVIDLIALIELDNVDAMGNPVGETGTPVGPGIEPDDDSICHYGPPFIGPDGTFDPAHVYRCNDDAGGPWFIGNFGDFTLDTPGGPNACLTGACCNMGSCTIESEMDCTTAGGTFLGSGEVCDPDPCGPIGACCDTISFDCVENTEAQCMANFPGRTWQGAGTTCAADCTVDSTGLIACTPGVDCTVGDVNGFCYFQTDFGSAITLAGCSGDAPSFFEVACPSTCDAIGSTVIFQIPADSVAVGVPPVDCLVEADLVDGFGGVTPADLSACDPTGLFGVFPVFEIAP